MILVLEGDTYEHKTVPFDSDFICLTCRLKNSSHHQSEHNTESSDHIIGTYKSYC